MSIKMSQMKKILDTVSVFVLLAVAITTHALYVNIHVPNGTAGIQGPYNTDSQTNYEYLYNLLDKVPTPLYL